MKKQRENNKEKKNVLTVKGAVTRCNFPCNLSRNGWSKQMLNWQNSIALCVVSPYLVINA